MRSGLRANLVSVVVAALIHAPVHAQIRGWKGRAQDDVAAVHVAVQSIAPFEIYVESLQPTFNLSTDDALKYSIAQTRTQGTATFRALQAVVNAAVDGTAPPAQQPAPQQPAPAPAQPATGPVPDPDNIATEGETPPAPAPGAGDAAENEAEAEDNGTGTSSLPPEVKRALKAELPEGATNIDPFVQHSAAAALLQYVTMLNNYVRDAAVRSGARPYVVRLLVTVLPTASTRGYDAYSTISFFTDPGPMNKEGRFAASSYALDSEQFAAKAEAKIERLQEQLRSADPEKQKKLEQQIESLATNPVFADASLLEDARSLSKCEARPLQIVPLLVTDNIESSLHRDSMEYVRNLAVALSSAGRRTVASAGLRSQLNDIAQTLTRNLNSLMTVGQIGTNSLRVRLGAAYGNRTDVMVARTYSVTALVLVPTAQTMVASPPPNSTIGTEILPCSIASFTAHSEFRNTRNGKLARSVSFRDLAYAVQDLIDVDPDAAERFVEAALADDYDAFNTAARRLRLNDVQKMDLWPRLQNLVARSSVSRGRFQVPLRDSAFFTNLTYASVFDDGKDSRLALQGGANLVAERIVGTLLVKVKSGDLGQQERDLYLSANRVIVESDRRSATLVFPSLDKLVKAENVKAVFGEVRYLPGVRNWQSRGPRESLWYLQDVNKPDEGKPLRLGSNPQEVPLSYYGPLKAKTEAQTDSAKPEFTVTRRVDTIVAEKDTGKVSLQFKHDKAGETFPIFFDVKAGDVVRVTPDITRVEDQWAITADKFYRVEFENLVPGTDLVINTWRLSEEEDEEKKKKKIDGPTLTFRVVEIAKPASAPAPKEQP